MELWLVPDLTSRSDQPVGASDYLHKIFSTKILTPKGVVIFILASLTNRSRQVNYRSMCDPCLVSCVKDKTGWWMFNVHLSYKTPSYWSILFCYGGLPRKFSCLKKFRSLIYPVRVCFKGVIIQGRYLPSGFPVIGQSWLRRKRAVTGKSVHKSRNSNSMYGHLDRRSIYETRRLEHPHLPIFRDERRPQVPVSQPCCKLMLLWSGFFSRILYTSYYFTIKYNLFPQVYA